MRLFEHDPKIPKDEIPVLKPRWKEFFCDRDTKTYYENPRKRGVISYKKTTNDWDLGYNFEGNEIIREWDPKPVFENTEMKFFYGISHKKTTPKLGLGVRVWDHNLKISRINNNKNQRP